MPFAHTYSIVARDAATGEMGVAVQSHWFSVGSIVTWGEAGVGVVATQAFVEPGYGPRGLDLMRSGLGAGDALSALVSIDKGAALRQVAMLDAKEIAAHTGEKCLKYAHHEIGAHCSAQANMMLNDRVVPALVRAFEHGKGSLADRMLAALEAAEAAGGDIRGAQSAAMLIVGSRVETGSPDKPSTPPRQARIDLRVEDHAQPVAELRRLLWLQKAYDHMNAGDAALETGNKEEAFAHYAAAASMVPDNLEIRFWHALTLAQHGDAAKAKAMIQEVIKANANWAEVLRRLPATGVANEAVVNALLA